MKILVKVVLMLFICISTCQFVTADISNAAANIPQGCEAVASTEKLTLYFNPGTYAISIEDKRNGYIWKSSVDDEVYDLNSVNEVVKNYMTSLFAFDYTDIKLNNGVLQKTYSSREQKKIKVKRITGGILLDYEFTNIGIGFTLEIRLDDDILTIRLPADKIRETGQNGLVSVEMMPFFGAADSRVDGYILYPDGCGALMRYRDDNRPKDIEINKKMYTWFVYGPEKVSSSEYLEMENKQKYQAMLPVFGVKNKNNAFSAVASEGEGDASINLSPEGYIIGLNRISFEFIYRHSFDIILSNISVNGINVSDDFTGIRMDKTITRQDHEIKYMFLEGDDANYSGMANSYREYLIRNNGLKKALKAGSTMPLAVDFFMGIKENRLLFDKFIAMTNFDQVLLITEKLINNGIKDLQVKLEGWTAGGYGLYPVNWPPERALGSTKGLEKYCGYTRKNNVKLFLQTNFINALGENGGFSTRNDVVANGFDLPVTDKKNNWFLLNPAAAFERLKTFLRQSADYAAGGIAIEKIGQLIYHDYNKNNPSTRVQTQKQWCKMLDMVSGQGRAIAAEGGNSYVLKFADRLFNIPVKTSDYYITDEVVPFYQMVVHGSIPYTSEPGNLFYDDTKQKLKWVEYGCMPYYELTYKKSRELKYTGYNKLFTSFYADWIDAAASVYKEFNKRLKGVWSDKMVEHERVGEKLYRIKYGNGTVVYVNYADKDVKCDGFRIKAEDYLVVEKGGIIK